MSTHLRRRTRLVAALSAGALGLGAAAALVAVAAPAAANSQFSFTRLQGQNRFATAAAIATATFSNPSTVLLANGLPGHFPDALAGTYLAGARTAPILLTTTDTLPAETQNALSALKPTSVVILGGTAAVSTAQENQLKASYAVSRLGGPDRYDTAQAIAEAPGASGIGTINGARTAVVASGQNFPDALVGGPLGFAKAFPVLITAGQQLSPQTKAALTDLGIKNVLLLGGTTVVSDATKNEIAATNGGISVTRLSGADRTGTATAVAAYALSQLGFSNSRVVLARGDDPADALAIGPNAGRGAPTAASGTAGTPVPVLLTLNPDTLGTQTQDYLTAHSGTLTGGVIAGGTSAVSAATESQATAAARGSAKVSITVTPTTVQAGHAVTGTLSGPNVKSATVSGCGLSAQTLTDADSSKPGIQFSLTIPAAQPPGSCTLSFTTTFTDTSTETDPVTLTVTAPASSHLTVLPELTGATVLGAVMSSGATPYSQLQVRFSFDSPVPGQPPVPADFHLVTYGDTTVNGQSAYVDSGGASVTVTFGTATQSVDPAQLSLATVSAGAVKDGSGRANPIGQAVIGTTSTRPVGPAGQTTAPDLVSVGGFVPESTAGTTAVSFTFDAPAYVPAAAKFHLVPTSGGAPTDCSGGTPGGAGTKTVVVHCKNGTATAGLDPSQFARGYVDPGAVNATSDGKGAANPLEAAPISNSGTSAGPDLLSVTFKPAPSASAADTAAYTFDQPVVLTDATKFGFFTPDATQTQGSSATVSSDGTVVTVTFSNVPGATPLSPSSHAGVQNAVGGNVAAGGVTGQGSGGLVNQADEKGTASLAQSSVVAGRTTGPDLVNVAIHSSSTGTTVTYTFDQAVDPTSITSGSFLLYLPDGTALTCGLATQNSSDPAAVDCNGYSVGAGPASAAQVQAGILGTVAAGAVSDASNAQPNPDGGYQADNSTSKPQG